MDHHLIQLTRPTTPCSPAKATPSNEARLFMCSSLYNAVYNYDGKLEKVMTLLLQQHGGTGVQHGQCDIQEVSAESNTVLHIAAGQGHHELIRELCARFRDDAASLLSSRNSALDTPLHHAAREGHGAAVLVLLQLAEDSGDGESVVRCKNEAGETALHLAARHGHAVVVETLASAAPGLASELNDAGVSPLYLAVMSRSLPAVRAITARCRDASSVGPCSQNALHAAVFQSSKMVELLLEWDPSLAHKVDCDGCTPLHFASSDGYHSTVRAILRVAPPSTVYMKDSGGMSAVHVAAMMGHARVVEELIRACPDAAELRDGNGRTFLHVAAMGKRDKVVALAIKNRMLGGLLIARDRNGDMPLHLAVAAGAPGVTEALMQTGKVRLDAMNNDGYTPFDLITKSDNFFSQIILVVTLSAFGVQPRPRRQDNPKEWSGHDTAPGWIKSTSDSLAVVAGLIATVAFGAAFNVPGGYSDGSEGKPLAGLAVLHNRTSYLFFVILDTVALAASIVAVILLVHVKATGSWKTFVSALQCIWVSLISMVLAFWASLVAVTNKKSTRIDAIYLILFIGIYGLGIFVAHRAMPVSRTTVFRFLCRSSLPGGRHVAGRRRITRQYPFAGSYSRNLLLFGAINILVYIAVLITVNRI